MRETAERHHEEFLERVRELNADDGYLYRCVRVVVFGSYLDPDAARLSDVDLAIELAPRYEGEEFDRRYDERIQHALARGRRFSNIVEQAAWPQNEVRRFLKAGSRVISLEDTRDKVLERVDHEEIYRWDG
jgi:predicted nucleotidyltransferase